MLENNVLEHLAHLRETLLGLSKIDSVTPPSDTREIVRFVAEQLRGLNNVDFKIYSEKAPIENIVAHVKGNGPGKHLMLNGHLDTFEVVQKENWKHDPFGGEVENGRLYGVGVSDMKAGCASLLETFILLAEHPDKWCGEVTLMLVGGEEAGGRYGTQYLLQSHPEWQKVDACLIADVGSSRVIRYGEKGRYRFKIMAHGIPGHGAHMHKTKNAIDLLIDAIVDYRETVKKLPKHCDPALIERIKEAGIVSETVAGKGETDTLLNVTSNIGVFRAGSAPNLVPGYAEVIIDSRLPIGVDPEDVESVLKEICERHPDITFERMMTCESLYSEPDHPFLKILKDNAEKVFKAPCATTIRVGGTDGKHVRRYGVPTFSCGVEGGNMGAPDEYVDFQELEQCFEIHARSCFEYLKNSM